MRTLLATLAVTFTLLSALPAGAQSDAPELPPPDEYAEEQMPLETFDYPPDEYARGTVLEVVETGTKGEGDFSVPYQVSRVRVTSGPERGSVLDIEHAGVYNRVGAGDKVILTKVAMPGRTQYFIADEYRLTPLAVILAVFFALAAFLGRRHGVMSIVGLAFSILVLAKFVVPQILAGRSPLLITLAAAVAIMIVSLYLAHGVNRRTTLALACTAITLAAAVGTASVFVVYARLMGLGSEDAAYLGFGTLDPAQLRGLLLGGIIIGTLGVLDDVTTAQTAAVEEISKANPALSARELYDRGLSVGREHIASLINTLALAYAGASLPLFLLFSLNHAQPLWVTLNSETVAEELVRTLVGSMALVLAVPISTALAAWAFGSKKGHAYFAQEHEGGMPHVHRH